MKRRKFIKSTAYASGGVLFLNLLLSCKNNNLQSMVLNIDPNSPFSMEFLRGNVGLFTESGGTIGFYIDKSDIVVIDTQFPENAKHLIDELQKHNEKPLSALINTHHHGDHTNGNIAFKGWVKEVVAHENCKKNLIKNTPEGKDQLLPTTTFDRSYNVELANEKLHMKYYGPAHTDGDIIIYFEKANIAHIGDLVFNRKYPYIDKNHGASIANWIKVLDEILSDHDDDTIFIWGHAGENYDVKGGKTDIKAFQNYLKNLLIIGQEAKAKEMSREEFLSAYTSIPNAPEWQGEGIERSLDAVYKEVFE